MKSNDNNNKSENKKNCQFITNNNHLKKLYISS